jgi:hypothetical protein
MSTTIERTDYFALSSWVDMSVSNNAIENELQTEASVEQVILNCETLGWIIAGLYIRSSYVSNSF